MIGHGLLNKERHTYEGQYCNVLLAKFNCNDSLAKYNKTNSEGQGFKKYTYEKYPSIQVLLM